MSKSYEYSKGALLDKVKQHMATKDTKGITSAMGAMGMGKSKSKASSVFFTASSNSSMSSTGNAKAAISATDATDAIDATDAEDVTDSYTIQKFLGKGVFGTVSLADHEKYGTIVVKEQLLQGIEDLHYKLNEVEVLEYLSKLTTPCPWVINIYGHMIEGNPPNKLTIFMEYFKGTDLKKLAGSFDFTTDGYGKWDMLFCDLVEAVHCIHEAGVAHRDIKLENVMFDDKCLKLVDFGLSCHMTDRPSKVCRKPLGTMFYYSPELWKRYDMPGVPRTTRDLTWLELQASDIWAVANVMYAMAYGKKILEIKGMTVAELQRRVLTAQRYQGTDPVRDQVLKSPKILGPYQDMVNNAIIMLLDPNPGVRISNFKKIWEKCSSRGPADRQCSY